MRLITLKKRREFLRLRGGARWANAAFILETKPRPEDRPKRPINRPSPKAGKNATRCGPGGAGPQDTRTQQGVGGTSTFAIDKIADPPRFGFTITKRIGNAVTRNLIRRRLKEAMRTLATKHAKPGFDYVIIAKSGILTCGYEQLTRDLKTALERVHQPRSQRPRTRQRRP